MSKYPIILIHKGNAPYLPLSILHNKRQNPDTEIILLGDKENAVYKDLVCHYHLKDYFHGAEELSKQYIHLSTNGVDFELICLQRWFALLEFMQKTKLDKCIFLDSDILSYTDLNAVWPAENPGMTMVGISAHTNFVSDVNVLREFCEFVLQCYREKADWLKERNLEVLAAGKGGGVSDMTFFTEFRKLFPGKIRNLDKPENGLFDITLDYHQGMEMEGDIKKVLFRGSVLFVTEQKTRKEIPVYTLHFQGKSKMYLKRFAKLNGKDLFSCCYLLTRFYLQRVQQKVRK